MVEGEGTNDSVCVSMCVSESEGLKLTVLLIPVTCDPWPALVSPVKGKDPVLGNELFRWPGQGEHGQEPLTGCRKNHIYFPFFLHSKKMLGCFNPILGQIWTNPAMGYTFKLHF